VSLSTDLPRYTYFSGIIPFICTSGSSGNGRGSNDAKLILNASGSASRACSRSVYKKTKAITYQFIFYSTNSIQDNIMSFVQEHDLDHIFQQNQNVTIEFICNQKATKGKLKY
jgi:hypothetical protein